ncbi:DUF3043 domain-containing protein [Ornithinimicrobium avium]|uniref:DUF3043 domain-containing protein n=1 Tax=Ornithinimicrobium avium TaxID=2283195 RepID=A0A345NSD6_9MICO|nr:DUF3043 domain-containing protein [Ornithinimicrobium avium]
MTAANAAAAQTSVDAARPQSKGRPTPKRRDAEAANRRPLVQDTRGKSPEQKAKIRADRAKARDGMMRGEEKYLMERDRGPERRFLRDAVDVRWNTGEILLPAMVIILALSLLPYQWSRSLFLLAYGVMIFGIVDAWLLWRRTRTRFVQAFGREPGRGSAWYVVLRSFQMRSSRVPRPAVKRGEELHRR